MGTIKVSALRRSLLGHLEKAVTAAVLIALAVTTAAILFTLIVEDRGTSEPFTEFYLLGSDGRADGYPTTLTVGEEASLITGILNQEREETVYSISLQINGAAVAEVGGARLSPGERWEQPVGLTLRQAGERQLVEFVLYMEGQSQPYRTLRLWVDGRPAVAAAETEATPTPTPTPPAPEEVLTEQQAPTPAQESPAAPEPPQPQLHIVVTGEHLTAISVQYDVPLKDVIAANDLPDPNLIHPNQRILIPVELR